MQSVISGAHRRGAHRFPSHPLAFEHIYKPVYTEAFKPVTGCLWQPMVKVDHGDHLSALNFSSLKEGKLKEQLL